MSLGGLWKPIGYALLAIPKPLRDLAYARAGDIRSHALPAPAAACPCVTPALKERFVAN
jgi:predicted DCC family thiol-disulfide oxidoreductase YuxK